MAGGEQLVVCAPLCFLFNRLGKTDLKKIKTVLLDFFSSEEIVKAKKIIVDNADKIQVDKKLPRVVVRRDSDVDRRTLKDVDDILLLATVLDERGLLNQLPRYVIDKTDRIPTFRLEEGELSYFVNRVSNMEDKISCLQATVNNLYTLIRTGIQASSSHNGVPDHVVNSNASQQVDHTLDPIISGLPDHTDVMNMHDRILQRVPQLDWAARCPSLSSAVQSGLDSNDADGDVEGVDDNDFQFQHRRKRRRARSQRNQSGVAETDRVTVQDINVSGVAGDAQRLFSEAVNVDRL
jgi:hypothetical protein